MQRRPDIPSRIKRKVRQRCGFGCVICGLPIYDYDHKPGFANVRRHRAEELTLLCPLHHTAKTKGLLSVAQVEEADRSPYNLTQGRTAPFALSFRNTSPPEIVLGELRFRCSDPRRPTIMAPVVVHKRIPFGFTLDSEGMLLNLDARDGDDKTILQIRDSEVILSTESWDATWVGQTLSIWNAPRNIILRIGFEPPTRIVIAEYRITTAGITIEVNQKGTKITGLNTPISLSGTGVVDANIGLLVGEAPKGLGVAISAGPSVIGF